MALKAFEEFLEAPLILPIGGKNYTIPPVSAVDGVRLSETLYAARTGADDVSDDSELDLYKQCLGTAYDAMTADGVPFAALIRAGKTAMYDFLGGREAAERFWNTGSVQGEAEASTTEASTSTGAATTTKRPASTSGTKPRPKRSPKP